MGDARSRHLFDKGWLPGILPASSEKIRVVSDVEGPAGYGEFEFDAADYAAFIHQLDPKRSGVSPVARHNAEIEALLGQDYTAYGYAERGVKWIFLCRQSDATCKFFMWG